MGRGFGNIIYQLGFIYWLVHLVLGHVNLVGTGYGIEIPIQIPT